MANSGDFKSTYEIQVAPVRLASPFSTCFNMTITHFNIFIDIINFFFHSLSFHLFQFRSSSTFVALLRSSNQQPSFVLRSQTPKMVCLFAFWLLVLHHECYLGKTARERVCFCFFPRVFYWRAAVFSIFSVFFVSLQKHNLNFFFLIF